jgi:hypothetical protein
MNHNHGEGRTAKSAQSRAPIRRAPEKRQEKLGVFNMLNPPLKL